MSQRTVFLPYQAKSILNKGKRADHWFWTRYSAYPYMGCQHGCAFCYCRERKYIPHKPEDVNAGYDEGKDEFAHLIKIKENAAVLLRKALLRLPKDMVFIGDYQPAERKYMLSRKMLEVCLEMDFPVFVLTRSPLVLRDLDLFKSINQRSRAVVAFSIISTPDSKDYEGVSRMEGIAPKAEKRFQAMEVMAGEGIITGSVAMPLLPVFCDNDSNLKALAEWTAGHGGQFVLGGGLTLADQQKEFFLRVLKQNHPDMVNTYHALYPAGSYAQSRPWRKVGSAIREACLKVGISDRIPRPIIPGEKREGNKRLVEKLAYELHTLELENTSNSRVWAYRKATWAIEDLEQDIGLIYQNMGRRGIESIPGIHPALVEEITNLIGGNQPKNQPNC
jgi:DNA repair photolyase